MSEFSNTKDWYGMSDSAIIREVAAFLKQTRLKKNYTQEELAEKAGINRTTISDLEHGRAISLTTFIQLLRALEQLDMLDPFTEKNTISPLLMAKLEEKKRKRASSSKKIKRKTKKSVNRKKQNANTKR